MKSPGQSGFFGGSGFSGDFYTLFKGVQAAYQSDCGVDYGALMLATASNTATTTVSFSGLLKGPTIPVLVKATNALAIGSGGAFNVYYDGVGTTPEMTGVVPVAGTPVALTGKGDGLFLTWTAGTVVINNTWKATARVWADQSGLSQHALQITPAKQPLIIPSLNGFAALQGSVTRAVNMAGPYQPGTSPMYVAGVFRQLAWDSTTQSQPISSGSGYGILYAVGSTPTLSAYAGAGVQNSGAPLNTWVDLEWELSNSASNKLKLGSTTVTGNAGNNSKGGVYLFGGTSGNYCDCEWLTCLIMNVQPSANDWLNFRKAIALKYGAGAVLT